MLDMLKVMLLLLLVEILTKARLSKASTHDINIHASTEGEFMPSTWNRQRIASPSRHTSQDGSSREASATMSLGIVFSDLLFNDGYIDGDKRSECPIPQ
jgi:hypothetical protein